MLTPGVGPVGAEPVSSAAAIDEGKIPVDGGCVSAGVEWSASLADGVSAVVEGGPDVLVMFAPLPELVCLCLLGS